MANCEQCDCDECIEAARLQREDEKLFAEVVRVPGYPECGDSTISVEEMYQAFRRRMLRELRK